MKHIEDCDNVVDLKDIDDIFSDVEIDDMMEKSTALVDTICNYVIHHTSVPNEEMTILLNKIKSSQIIRKVLITKILQNISIKINHMSLFERWTVKKATHENDEFCTKSFDSYEDALHSLKEEHFKKGNKEAYLWDWLTNKIVNFGANTTIEEKDDFDNGFTNMMMKGSKR